MKLSGYEFEYEIYLYSHIKTYKLYIPELHFGRKIRFNSGV